MQSGKNCEPLTSSHDCKTPYPPRHAYQRTKSITITIAKSTNESQNRETSSSGIYHVMLRGINKQNIFFCEDDYVRMMNILHESQFEFDPLTDKIVSDNLCTIYAYCILDNHVHILIREGDMEIAGIMQSIEIRYALYYNKKYERVGHLFQARFKSEPVNDSIYFFTLLRYIHRNSVKALEAHTPEEYPYSSWNEYVHHPSNLMHVLKPSAIQATLIRYPLEDLTEWVNTPSSTENTEQPLPSNFTKYGITNLSKADDCLDMDRFPNPISDREAFEILSDLSGYTNPEDFRLLDAPTQIYYLLQAIEQGITLRQASRLGTITYYQIRKAVNKKRESNTSAPQKQGDSSIIGSGTSVEKNKEILASEKQGDSPITGSGTSVENKEILLTPMEKLEQAMRDIEMQFGIHPEAPSPLQRANDAIRNIEGQSKKSYHRMHLIVEYLYSHPNAKCQEIAEHIQTGNERTRIHLVQLANANIIQIQGNARSRTYSLRAQL